MKPAPSDPPEIEHVLWNGISGFIAWDVGANTGQSVHILAERFKQVVAFEPAAECFGLLWNACVTAANRNSATVILKPYAISDHDGQIALAALPDKIDTGQLVTPGTAGMEWSPQEWDTSYLRPVECRSLDSLVAELPRPDFVKVDVEGHERAVLDGAHDLADAFRPTWLIEFHTPELADYCWDFLAEHDYRIEVVRHPHYPVHSQMWYQHGWLRGFPTD